MKGKRLALLLFCALVGIYLALYFANSIGGGYRLYFVSTINHRVDYDAPIDAKTNGGAIAWQPRYGNYNRLTSDTLGKLFYPLICIDQTFWHRDLAASDVESQEAFEKRVSLQQVHPEDRKRYGARPYD